jgi:nucleotide-binding universal stress UspA family protein
MIETILVATDFSGPSDRALGEAVSLARALGAGIEIMHVHEIALTPLPPTLDLATLPPPPEQVARTEAALAQRERAVAEKGVPCKSYATFGRPAEEVVRRATEVTPRMLVVGTHGHNLLRHMLMGSVAEHIVQKAPCPVMVVPPVVGRA